jgi:hypothetical protein
LSRPSILDLHQDGHSGGIAMSFTIFYHNPERPDEGSMTMIAGQPNAASIIARLEKRGFVVDKITFAEPRRISRGKKNVAASAASTGN